MSFLFVLVGAIVGFAVTSGRLCRDQEAREALLLARAWADGLVLEDGAELGASVERLREQYGQLLAVGVIGPTGSLQALYPERPEYGRLVAKALDPTVMLVSDPGGGETVWRVVVPVDVDSGPTARGLLVLFSREPFHGRWIKGTIVFTAVTALTGCVGIYLLSRWFDRRVVGPLRSLGQPLAAHSQFLERPLAFRTGGWRETNRIADQYRELLGSLRESDARAKRIEDQAQRHLRRREAGFDRQLRRAKDRALIDPLTGLHNRTVLDEEFEPLLESQRIKDEDLSVVMLDIDNFKGHNDTFGHRAGDEVLRFVGELLHAALRPGDYAIRYGGDEFCLLLPEVSTRQARGIAKRITKLFAQYARSVNPHQSLSLSAGVAALTDHPGDAGLDLLARADAALYAAKRAGKNTVRAA